ncbi:thiamine-phosphate diphosphorylase [Belliella baltica DSM 15883]|uniref:Thiamine-phosphate synthase n=1 Tax=Belliella baltica (strain DSM 15883 / CIP 108006 / LMG 21964 / BA134) TaxID=866536 RepID=I3Z8V5_BELBD|nr:thiamine phosphate synthase [Belliella baltica]AFL85673.1 thiamine-phosphate diphosphorylase [Belliella baltica DSM 15883]
MKYDFPYRLYLVTDQLACLGRDFFWVVEEALKGGAEIVQLREKELSEPDFIRKAERLKIICDQYQVPLIINDNAQVAKHVGAYGLHVGQSDLAITDAKQVLGKDYPIGLSIEQLEDIQSSESEMAWYYGVSPIYSTPTKIDTRREWGLNGLRELQKISRKKLVAIGNIKIQNAADVIEAGADCLAVVSGICSADYPAKAAEAFRIEIEKGLKFK